MCPLVMGANRNNIDMLEENEFEVIDSLISSDGTQIEVLAFPELRGSSDVRTASSLFYAKESGMRLKIVRITLNDGKFRVEPGALHYMRGDLEMKTSTGGGILKGLSRKMLAGETFFVNEIHGTGKIYLEPTFGHFFLYQVDPEEGGVIVDKGLFFAGTSDLDISAAAQKNISSALFGGEGWFQTSISGTGIAVLYSPVPSEELMRIELNDEKLWLDGNFALVRSHDIEFRAEKSSKSIASTLVSGELILQTFKGVGSVWIAPTQGVYERMARDKDLAGLADVPASMGTMTKSLKKRK